VSYIVEKREREIEWEEEWYAWHWGFRKVVTEIEWEWVLAHWHTWYGEKRISIEI